MRIVFDKLTQTFRKKFQEIDWGKFVFYFSVSGIESIFIIILTYIYASSAISLPASRRNNEFKFGALEMHIQISLVVIIIIFFTIYLYSLIITNKYKSWYRKIKKLFIIYPLFIIALLQIIINHSDIDSRIWWGIGFLVWLTCYMVTETIMEIFDKRIMPSWKEIPAKDKYSLLIPVITFILGYILSN